MKKNDRIPDLPFTFDGSVIERITVGVAFAMDTEFSIAARLYEANEVKVITIPIDEPVGPVLPVGPVGPVTPILGIVVFT